MDISHGFCAHVVVYSNVDWSIDIYVQISYDLIKTTLHEAHTKYACALEICVGGSFRVGQNSFVVYIPSVVVVK